MTKIITNYSTFMANYDRKLTNYGKKVLQITSEIYYKLRQLKFLQIIDNYYKLQQFSMLLQTTSKTITTWACITNCGVIINCIVTTMIIHALWDMIIVHFLVTKHLNVIMSISYTKLILCLLVDFLLYFYFFLLLHFVVRYIFVISEMFFFC